MSFYYYKKGVILMKRIFFSTNNNNTFVNGINGKITELTLVNFNLKSVFFEEKIILKEIGVLGNDLNKMDIENLLKEMYLKTYDYNFIKLKAEKCSLILKDGFKNFLKNFESELMSNIQSEKIENIDIDKEYNKVMGYQTITITKEELDKNNFSNNPWESSNTLTDEKIKEIYNKTRKEFEFELEKRKYEVELELEKQKIEKIILKSLYYLQVELLTLEELEELIKIYDEYITKITNSFIIEYSNLLVRCIIHSICILEKIYITNLRLKSTIKNEFKIFRILSKQLKVVQIKYEVLEEELIKCLLFKLEDENYTFKSISPSFYLTTPLRMSCLSYVQTIITLDELIKKDKKLDKVLKDSFTSQKEYNKYLSGAKLLNDSSIKNFSEVYLQYTEDTTQYISNLYYIYFKYKTRDRIKNNYSDKAITFYEKMNIEDYIYKEKILKSIELIRHQTIKINIILSEVENFTRNIGKDFVIHLNEKMILKNTQKLSLNLHTNKVIDSKIIKEQYISTSRETLSKEILRENNHYCLVKFLEIKNVENMNFYIFESQILLGDFFANSDIICTHVLNFILLENDFNVVGKVSAINYLF